LGFAFNSAPILIVHPVVVDTSNPAIQKDFQSFFACVFAAFNRHPTAHPVNVCPDSRAACSICIPGATGDTTLCSCLSQQTLNRPLRVILPRVSCALPDLLPVGITDSTKLSAWVWVVRAARCWRSADFWFWFFGHWLALIGF
jgi:hypothetical protein